MHLWAHIMQVFLALSISTLVSALVLNAFQAEQIELFLTDAQGPPA